MGELIAGTSLRGMLEEKITKIFNDVLDFNKNNQMKIILFIDEFHMMTKPCWNPDISLEVLDRVMSAMKQQIFNIIEQIKSDISKISEVIND